MDKIMTVDDETYQGLYDSISECKGELDRLASALYLASKGSSTLEDVDAASFRASQLACDIDCRVRDAVRPQAMRV